MLTSNNKFPISIVGANLCVRPNMHINPRTNTQVRPYRTSQ